MEDMGPGNEVEATLGLGLGKKGPRVLRRERGQAHKGRRRAQKEQVRCARALVGKL